MRAELPKNEEQRLATLRSFAVLDTPYTDRFDRLTRTAARLFDVPTALVSLVDENRQWFKSRCGLDVAETDRDVAFCAHSILQEDVFVVLDATKNPTFADNPLVTGAPHIRFYAGAPLMAPDGAHLGTFCIIDYVPRTEFSDEDRAALKDLAAAAMDQFIIERSLGTDIGVVANQNDNDVLLDMADVYMAFVKQSPLPAVMLDNQLRIMAESDRWRQFWKSDSTTNHHSLPLRAAYPSIPERWNRELEACVRSNLQSAGLEQFEITPDEEKYIIWEISHWQLSNGASGAFLFVRDQSEQRKAEKSAQIFEHLFKSVFQKTPVMMHSVDAAGHLLEVSDLWLEKLGYRREEVLGRPSTDFLTPESNDYARETVLPAFVKTGICEDIAYQFVCANGDLMNVLLTASAERDDSGNIIRSVAVLCDFQDIEARMKWLKEYRSLKASNA